TGVLAASLPLGGRSPPPPPPPPPPPKKKKPPPPRGGGGGPPPPPPRRGQASLSTRPSIITCRTPCEQGSIRPRTP
ncbi:hypothetical protein EJ882_15160, partial [Klebsiella pneumoniae subsp. pneumoniae]